MNLQEEYEDIVDKYIEVFEEKHTLDFDGWVGDRKGTTAAFSSF